MVAYEFQFGPESLLMSAVDNKGIFATEVAADDFAPPDLAFAWKNGLDDPLCAQRLSLLPYRPLRFEVTS